MPYKAFISYSTAADGKFAPALQSALHNFAKPWYKLRSIRVFRDATSLAATPELWPSIEAALNESEYFLLLASPQAAQSYWVDREVKWWLENRSNKKMFIVLTDGVLLWDRTTNDYDWEQTTALPNSLHNQFKNEPLYVDFRWIKKGENLSLRNSQFRSTVLGLAAPLYGKEKDELDGEDVRQRRRNVRFAWSAGFGLSIAIFLAVLGGREATLQQRMRYLTGQSELLRNQQTSLLAQSVLLATEAMKHRHTFESDQALYKSLSLLGPNPITKRTYKDLKDIVLSPHGKYLALIPFEGYVEIQDTISGKTTNSLINLYPNGSPIPAIRQISFSANEKYIATLSSLGISTFVWELPTGREVFRTPVNRGAITVAALSTDGNYLATGHTDGKTYIWEVSSGHEVLSFSHSDSPTIIKFSPDGKYLAVTSSQGIYYGSPSKQVVSLWNVSEGREIAKLKHNSPITQFTFSPNSKYIATTSRVGQEQEEKERIGIVKIWYTEIGREMSHIEQENEINTMTFSPRSTYLLTGSPDGTARFWSIESGEEQLSTNHGSNVDLVDFFMLENYTHFITAGNDGVVRFWGLYSPVQELLRLLELDSPKNIIALTQSADRKYLVTISHSLEADASVPPDQFKRYVRVWTFESIQENLRLEHENIVIDTYFSPDGKYLVTFDTQVPASKLIPKTESNDSSIEYTDLGSGSVSVWEVSTRRRITHLRHSASLMSIDYDPTGKYMATASVDGFVRVFDALSGEEMAKLKHDGWIFKVTFSPDGRYVSTSSGSPKLLEGKQANGVVTIWEWQSARKTGHLQGNYLISDLAFSSDGQLLAAGGHDGTVHILRATDGEEVLELHQEDPVWTLVFSPDGRYLATGGGGSRSKDSPLQKGTTILWDVKNGHETVLEKHQSWVLTVAFSPDGKYVASMDQNGTVGIWATASIRKISSMKHDEFVAEATVTFSPDSQYLATAFGKQAQVWEVTTGREVARREHALGNLWDVTFSPDGKYLATASTDTTAGLWLWHPEDLINEACDRLPRNLDNYHSVCTKSSNQYFTIPQRFLTRNLQ
jgi:WD40 repeat protein